MIFFSRQSRQELGALVVENAMHMTLHWENGNVWHIINLDSLFDHDIHCWAHDRVSVCNHSIYGAGIAVPDLLVKSININKTFVIVNN